MGNISGWSEGILLSVVFLGVLALVVANFNGMYGQNYALPISDNSTEQLFINYQDNAQTQITDGEVQFDATQGVTLKSSYGLAKDGINIVWTFLSGGFIEKTAEMWNAGESGMLLARGLRIVWFLSLIFALLYALFKVVL